VQSVLASSRYDVVQSDQPADPLVFTATTRRSEVNITYIKSITSFNVIKYNAIYFSNCEYLFV